MSFSINVSGSPGIATGKVTLMADGVAAAAPQSLSGGGATVIVAQLCAGVHSMTASYDGDETHESSSTAQSYSQVVQKMSPSLSVNGAPGSITVNSSVVFTAIVTGAQGQGQVAPSGAVQFSDSGTILASTTINGSGSATFATNALLAGSHNIIASYAGDANYAGATQSFTQLIQKTSAPFTVNGPTYAVSAGESVTFSAVLADAGEPVVAGGSVSFQEDGNNLGVRQLDPSGVARLNTSALTAGLHNIVASYSGDSNYDSETQSYSQTVQKASPSLSLSSPAGPVTAGSPATFTAMTSVNGPVQPSGSISFLQNGAPLGSVNFSKAGTASVVSNNLLSGSVTVSASYAGDSNFQPASVFITEDVPPAVTTTTPGLDSGYPSYGYAATVGANSLTSLPFFNAVAFGVSASANTGTCTGSAGSNALQCTLANNDFVVGQGLWLSGAGRPSLEAPITTKPIVTENGSAPGTHTYCYIVATADPENAISQPSPSTCIWNEPLLSYLGVSNQLSASTDSVGPSPTFLWYASLDDGPYQLVSVQGFHSAIADMGQRLGNHNGWPNNFSEPASITKSEDLIANVTGVSGNNITIDAQLASSVADASVQHDDTAATESAILAADSAGGGIVRLPAGTVNIRRPSFSNGGAAKFKTYTTNILQSPWWSPWTYLYLPTTSGGHVSLEAEGSETHIVLPPDHSKMAYFFSVGDFGRGYQIEGLIKMDDVALGAVAVNVTNNPTGNPLTAGEDVWLYTGSSDPSGVPCVDDLAENIPGPSMCHFSELNTIASVHGNSVTLVYPTSKRYYDDGTNSFGMVVMPTTPHIVGFQHFILDGGGLFTGCGMSYGMLINDVHITQPSSGGPLGCGFRRDVTVENSSWITGAGDAGWNSTDEFDEDTNFAIFNNQIVGIGAPGAEYSFQMPLDTLSEGSSHFLYDNNQLTGLTILTHESADDVVVNNTFDNGILAMGSAYGTNSQNWDFYHVDSFTSFGGQGSLLVQSNAFNIHSPYAPPTVIRTGHYESSQVVSNSIIDASSRWTEVLKAYSGVVSSNSISVTGVNSAAITLVGDQSTSVPDSSFEAQGNIIGGIPGVGVFVVDPGFTATAPVCVANNQVPPGVTPLVVVNPSNVNMSCSSSSVAVLSAK